MACPGDAVTFMCSVTGTVLQWKVDPPPGSGFSQLDITIRSNTLINVPLMVGSDPEFQFVSVPTVVNQGDLRSTLTTISNISSLRGSMVTCQEQGPLTIQVAGINRQTLVLNVVYIK